MNFKFLFLLFFVFIGFIDINLGQTISKSFVSKIETSTGKTIFKDISIIQNPALLKLIDSGIVNLSFSPSRFGLSELSPLGLFFANNLNKQVRTSASIIGLGNNLYNEFDVGIQTGYIVNKLLTLGFGLEYARLSVKDYSSEFNLFLDFGAVFDFNNSFSAGFSLQNVSRSFFTNGNNNVRQNAIIGLGYSAYSFLDFELNAVISINQSSGFSFASKYNYENVLSMRAAVLSDPLSLETGFFVHIYNPLIFISNIDYHHKLGLSQTFGLAYTW